MKEVEFTMHAGRSILRIEFGLDLSNERILAIMEQAKKVIATQPLGSVLTLTILGEFHFDTETARAFREYLAHNRPYVRAGAVLGIYGLRKALYNSLMILTRRNIKICDTEEEAREFLARAG